jgi:hypothetical protein
MATTQSETQTGPQTSPTGSVRLLRQSWNPAAATNIAAVSVVSYGEPNRAGEAARKAVRKFPAALKRLAKT